MPKLSKATADRYRALQSIHQGHTDDLVKENKHSKVWRSRVELDNNGLPLISIEKIIRHAESGRLREPRTWGGDRWEVVQTS